MINMDLFNWKHLSHTTFRDRLSAVTRYSRFSIRLKQKTSISRYKDTKHLVSTPQTLLKIFARTSRSRGSLWISQWIHPWSLRIPQTNRLLEQWAEVTRICSDYTLEHITNFSKLQKAESQFQQKTEIWLDLMLEGSLLSLDLKLNRRNWSSKIVNMKKVSQKRHRNNL